MNHQPDPLEERLRQLPPCRVSPHLADRILQAWQERRPEHIPRRGLVSAAIAVLACLMLLTWHVAKPRPEPDRHEALLREVASLRQELAALRDLGADDRALVNIDDLPGYDILLSLNKKDPAAKPTCFYRAKSPVP